MPDIVRLRYIGAGTVTVPAIGKEIESDCLVEIPGRILDEHPADGPHKARPVPENADYLLIAAGNPPTVQAWPTSLWVNETPVAAQTPKEK